MTFESNPVSHLLEEIIDQALKKQASDVHFEATENDLRVRLRIHGRLVLLRRLPGEIHKPILLLLKMLGHMRVDLAEVPQDGKWLRDGNPVVDVRLSILPSINGECAVLRLLRGERNALSLNDLGFENRALHQEIMELLSQQQGGLMLFVGPTGSGKSTTAYAFLRKLNDGCRKILTVEDPVESVVDGLSQVALGPRLSFSDALKAAMRQAPNLLFVGEIRDSESAKIALQAALTGHMVVSTLHCGSASEAIDRLTNLGLNGAILRDVMKAVLAQRLIRRLCPFCRMFFKADEALKARLNLTSLVARATGCERCTGQGFVGRTVIYEWLNFSPKTFHSFYDCAREKIQAGTVSAEEVLATLTL